MSKCKIYLSIDELIENIKGKGLKIKNEKELKEILS